MGIKIIAQNESSIKAKVKEGEKRKKIEEDSTENMNKYIHKVCSERPQIRLNDELES